MAFTKDHLSGSTDGKGIKVAQTATAGTNLHTGPTDTGIFHEVWIWAVNSDTAWRKLTIEFGGASAPDNLIECYLAPEDGLKLIVPGLVIQGNGSALTIAAFASSANVIMCYGYVNVIA